jgi:hypothetical protein
MGRVGQHGVGCGPLRAVRRCRQCSFRAEAAVPKCGVSDVGDIQGVMVADVIGGQVFRDGASLRSQYSR